MRLDEIVSVEIKSVATTHGAGAPFVPLLVGASISTNRVVHYRHFRDVLRDFGTAEQLAAWDTKQAKKERRRRLMRRRRRRGRRGH